MTRNPTPLVALAFALALLVPLCAESCHDDASACAARCADGAYVWTRTGCACKFGPRVSP